jgi:hypothetical protein
VRAAPFSAGYTSGMIEGPRIRRRSRLGIVWLIPVASVLIPSFVGCGSRTEDVTPLRDFTTPEGAVLCLEDAYRACDIEAVIKCKDFRIEARLMLGKLQQDFSGDKEVLAKTAELLELSFRKELQTNGFPDFEGLECRFVNRAPYENQDDIVIVTEICTFPDGGTSTQKILVANTESGWRVLNPID